MAALAGPDTATTTRPLVADPALVAVYERMRVSVPELIEALAPVAALFARGEIARGGTPEH